MYMLNGKQINTEAPIVSDEGTQFPSGFFHKEEIQSMFGVTQAPDVQYPDDRFYSWTHNSDGTLNIQAKDLSECQSLVVSELKRVRDEKFHASGFKVTQEEKELWFQSDLFSRTQQSNLARMAEGVSDTYVLLDAEGNGILWRTRGGEQVLMTAGLARAIAQASVHADLAVFKAFTTHEYAIYDLLDVAAVAEYDYSKGWPEAYIAKS